MLKFLGLCQALVCVVSLGLAMPAMVHAAPERTAGARTDVKSKSKVQAEKSAKRKLDDAAVRKPARQSEVRTAQRSAKERQAAAVSRPNAKPVRKEKLAQRAGARPAQAAKEPRRAATSKHATRNILAPQEVTRPARVERVAVVRAAAVSASALPAFAPMSVSADIVPRAPAMSMASDSRVQRASFGRLYGLHETRDPLELQSSVALVVDQDTNEVVFAKNSDAVLPIASLTKLMTALVVTEANLSLDEQITITSEDVDTLKFSSSRLPVGTTLSRGELLHLALMSSENRAAHALGRTYPGGVRAFISAMNAKARLIGMQDSRFADPTGLSSHNQSSARDLSMLARVAYQNPLIRDLSVSPEYAVVIGQRHLQYRNTNSLVRRTDWDIGLQKTGYIVEAGRCLVMQARMAGRKFIMVFLDSDGKQARLSDAERIRRWLEMAAEEGSLGVYLPRAKVTS